MTITGRTSKLEKESQHLDAVCRHYSGWSSLIKKKHDCKPVFATAPWFHGPGFVLTFLHICFYEIKFCGREMANYDCSLLMHYLN